MIRLTLFAPTIVLVLLPLVSFASWQPGGNFICVGFEHQIDIRAVSDGNLGAIVIWQDYRGPGVGIYGQRIGASGALQWTPDGVAIITPVEDEGSYDVVSDGAGGAIVVWSGGQAPVARAQRINAAGIVQWTPGGVQLSTANSQQWIPRLVADGSGGAIVAWKDYVEVSASDVYAQRINAAGTVLWTPTGVALCTAAFDQHWVSIVTDGAGGAVVTWADHRSGTYDVYARRVNSLGTALWTTDGVALCTAVNDQIDVEPIPDGAGGAIVTWDDFRGVTTTGRDIYAQRVNASGTVQWTTDGVALCMAPHDQTTPVIVSDAAGGAIVAWEDDRSGIGSSDLYAQGIDASGTVKWIANGLVLSGALENQYNQQIISDGAGGAIVTWADGRSGTMSQVYARRVDVSGTVLWTFDGVPVAVTPFGQYNPAIAPDGSGGAIVAWLDKRNASVIDNYDIYAQRLSASGLVPTGIRDTPSPSVGLLVRNHPNPFSARTTIALDLPADSEVGIDVFDAAGRRVRAMNLGRMSAGPRTMTFDGLDDNGRQLPNGVYFCRVHANSATVTSKMVIAR